jgi:hypothetical protein
MADMCLQLLFHEKSPCIWDGFIRMLVTMQYLYSFLSGAICLCECGVSIMTHSNSAQKDWMLKLHYVPPSESHLFLLCRDKHIHHINGESLF